MLFVSKRLAREIIDRNDEWEGNKSGKRAHANHSPKPCGIASGKKSVAAFSKCQNRQGQSHKPKVHKGLKLDRSRWRKVFQVEIGVSALITQEYEELHANINKHNASNFEPAPGRLIMMTDRRNGIVRGAHELTLEARFRSTQVGERA